MKMDTLASVPESTTSKVGRVYVGLKHPTPPPNAGNDDPFTKSEQSPDHDIEAPPSTAGGTKPPYITAVLLPLTALILAW